MVYTLNSYIVYKYNKRKKEKRFFYINLDIDYF